MPIDRMIIDPTTGGLGYGLEYSYSVMERIRMAALAQGDDKLQLPLINNLGNEVWKCKEAKQSIEEAPILGDPERRGILMEAVGAVAYLMSGSDVLIMRHPESIRLVKSYIDLIYEGGMASDVAAIQKQLDEASVDLLSLSPEPDLTIVEEKAAKPAAAKKAPAPAPEKKAEPEAKKPAAPAPEKKAAPEPAKAAEVVDLADAKAKAEEDAKVKAAQEAKVKVDAEAQAKADAEARQKAEADAQAKAEAEAQAKAEAEAQKAAEEKAKIEAELDTIRQKRAKEREKLAAKRAAAAEQEVDKTPAAEQKSMTEKMVENLDWIHKRG